MPNACIKFYVTINIPVSDKILTDIEYMEIANKRLKLIKDSVTELADKANGFVYDLEIKEF